MQNSEYQWINDAIMEYLFTQSFDCRIKTIVEIG